MPRRIPATQPARRRGPLRIGPQHQVGVPDRPPRSRSEGDASALTSRSNARTVSSSQLGLLAHKTSPDSVRRRSTCSQAPSSLTCLRHRTRPRISAHTSPSNTPTGRTPRWESSELPCSEASPWSPPTRLGEARAAWSPRRGSGLACHSWHRVPGRWWTDSGSPSKASGPTRSRWIPRSLGLPLQRFARTKARSYRSHTSSDVQRSPPSARWRVER